MIARLCRDFVRNVSFTAIEVEDARTLPSRIASSSLRSLACGSSRVRTVSASYKVEPWRNKTAFSRTRLGSDSGVVEAKYETKDVSERLDEYEDARRYHELSRVIESQIAYLSHARASRFPRLQDTTATVQHKLWPAENAVRGPRVSL